MEPWIFRRIGSWRDLYGKGPPRPKTLLSVVSHIVLTPINTNSCRTPRRYSFPTMVSAVKQQKKEQLPGATTCLIAASSLPLLVPHHCYSWFLMLHRLLSVPSINYIEFTTHQPVVFFGSLNCRNRRRCVRIDASRSLHKACATKQDYYPQYHGITIYLRCLQQVLRNCSESSRREFSVKMLYFRTWVLFWY